MFTSHLTTALFEISSFFNQSHRNVSRDLSTTAVGRLDVNLKFQCKRAKRDIGVEDRLLINLHFILRIFSAYVRTCVCAYATDPHYLNLTEDESMALFRR
jgi:hypothetical protein